MKTSLLISLLVLVINGAANAAGTIDGTSEFSCAANIGWVNFEGDVANGAVDG